MLAGGRDGGTAAASAVTGVWVWAGFTVSALFALFPEGVEACLVASDLAGVFSLENHLFTPFSVS